MDELAATYAVADGLETHLASEYDNGASTTPPPPPGGGGRVQCRSPGPWPSPFSNQPLIYKQTKTGRVLKLLLKLGAVVDRPAHGGVDGSWAETGDRFLLKLFRNYLFHQVSTTDCETTSSASRAV